MHIISVFSLISILFFSSGVQPEEKTYDLVVYGGSSSGVIAAYAAAQEGLKVALIEPGSHLGGLSSSGLGHVDIGNQQTVGGHARKFLTRVGKHYGQERMCIDMESSVAEKIFSEMLAQTNVEVFYNSSLSRRKGVSVNGRKISRIVLEDGRVFRAPYYIDATYVGDLMASAGVSYTVGRESTDCYGESSAGIQSYKQVRRFDPTQLNEVKELAAKFPLDYVFSRRETVGQADKRVQAYTYRLCVTTDENNKKAFGKPLNYDSRRYRHILERIMRHKLFTLDRVVTLYKLPCGKFDLNHMDLINASWKYAEGSYAERKYIENYHKEYQQGLLYFLANDPLVPKPLREDTHRYGYALDEFADNDNWPYHLYAREARRMKGEHIMTQHDAWETHTKEDAIALGSYFMDSHTVERFITPDGMQYEEGEMKHAPFRPYQIPYRSLTPRREECENLLVTVCLSASHVIYGSLRMEPVFMMTGHAAGVAVALAKNSASSVQSVEVKALQDRLLAQGQILNHVSPEGFFIDPQTVEGYVMDDTDALLKGYWEHSVATGPFLTYDYRYTRQRPDGNVYAEYTPQIEEGLYEVQIMYAADQNRSKAVQILIRDAEGEKEIYADMTRPAPSTDYWVSLGEYRSTNTARLKVTITNKGEGGVVIADGVRFIKK